MQITIIGCGKLGSVFGNVLARHHTVFGYDTEKVSGVHFKMIDDLYDAVVGSDYVVLVLPTQHPDPIYEGSEPNSHLPPKDFDYSIIIDTLKKLDGHLRDDQTIIIMSTVSAGTMRNVFQPLISNRLVYSPFIIAQGSIESDILTADVAIIGTDENDESDDIVELYKSFLLTDVFFSTGTWEEGELTKMAYNTYMSMKITFANMIDQMANKVGHSDGAYVMHSLTHFNKLFSNSCLTPGMPVGGVCLPRDNIVMSYLAQKHNLGYDVFNSLSQAREQHAKQIAEMLLSYERPIVILGKTYKKHVPLIQGSPSLLVAHYLGNAEYYFHDPVVNEHAPVLEDAVYLKVYEYGDFDIPSSATVIDIWKQI